MKTAKFKAIKVKDDTHGDMKLYAVKNKMSLIDVLEKAWACLKKAEKGSKTSK